VTKGKPTSKAGNTIAICELIFYKMWEPRCLTNLCASAACYRDNFGFLVSAVIIMKQRTPYIMYVISQMESEVRSCLNVLPA
jgi:hypothetical protein